MYLLLTTIDPIVGLIMVSLFFLAFHTIAVSFLIAIARLSLSYFERKPVNFWQAYFKTWLIGGFLFVLFIMLAVVNVSPKRIGSFIPIIIITSYLFATFIGLLVGLKSK